MIALLKTRCGCQRVIEISKGWMDGVIKIPLECRIRVARFDDHVTLPEIPFREFQTAGDCDEVGRMIFTEVEK